jgi:polysaccharide deacetylase family protein (PEP-CTERM system associated)
MTTEQPGVLDTKMFAAPLRAMTVDVEEYYHASALASTFPRATWASLESRVERTTRDILSIFAKHNVKATFFMLGSVARSYPALVRDIAYAGHELASHGNAHFRVGDQSPRDFRADVSSAKASIEDACGKPVSGYRAASFSINRATWWAYEILAETGYRYSSSVYPIYHDHYGLVGGPTTPFCPLPQGFVEIPITTVMLGNQCIPAGGGGYFRLMPWRCFAWLYRRAGAVAPHRSNFYFHPWEIDPSQPRGKTDARSRFRHYVNLSRMKPKIEMLAAEFSWGTMQDVYADCFVPTTKLPAWTPETSVGAGTGSNWQALDETSG